MYQFRSFRNSDPPHLADIWRDQTPQRGLMRPVTAAILEQLVFSKPYFDPESLLVALADNVPVAFVHAGFGANDEGSALATELGTTYQLMLRADHPHEGIADELLARAETYLHDRGAEVIYAGGIRPLNGFYLGLYGGSELPGVLIGDTVFAGACARRGYREIDRAIVMQLDMACFHQPFSRHVRQLRREMSVTELYNPPAGSWWDACTMADFERLQFSLNSGSGKQMAASVRFWNIEPLSMSWGVPTAGMLDLEVTGARRRQGLATFLLSEAFERLRSRGIVRVEAQTMQRNAPAIALYEKLGFTKVDEGVVFRKE